MISDGPAVTRLASFVNGYPFKPEQLGETGLPVIRIRHLLDERVEPDRAEPPDRAVFINDDDLVFSWSATLSVLRWRRGQALLNQHLFRVDPSPDVDRRWLQYVLEVGIERLRPLMHGSAMTHITLEMLRGLRVSRPTLGEQRAIADFLDAETARIDALIAKKRRLIELLDERQSAIIIRTLAGDGSGNEVRPLRSYAEVALGRQRSPAHDSGPHMVTYLRAANVKDGALDLRDVKEMNFDPREQSLFRLRPGDVLVTEGSGSLSAVGASAVWAAEIDGVVCFQNTLLRLRPLPSTDPRFLAWWCRYAFSDGVFASIATGANIFHVSADRVRALPMTYVPLPQQRKIADLLDTVTARIGAARSRLESQMTLLIEHRQALITAAVTGELAVPGAAA